MDRCAPAYADQTISCMSKDALSTIVKSYNSRNLDPIQVNNSSSKKDIWEAIQQKMSHICGNDETCWLEQPGIKNIPQLNEFFKPLAPLGRYQWLSTDDILNVMKQYEKKYPRFKFVGPLPMDFLSLKDNDSKFLQSLNLNSFISQKYDNIGIIFNMDPSSADGSHWIAMNINLRNKEIYFFDSYGDKHVYNNTYMLPFYDSYGKYHRVDKIALPPNIQKFIFRIMVTITPELRELSQKTINQMAITQKHKPTIKMPYKLKINTIQHQFANSECGVYSILFIIKSQTDSFENISRDIIADESANKYRDTLFRRK